MEVWESVLGCGGGLEVRWDVMWGSVGEDVGKYVEMWGR